MSARSGVERVALVAEATDGADRLHRCLRRLGSLCLPLALCLAWTGELPAQSPKDRILLVVVDGLRPDYITPELMPRLDALAQSGVRGLRHHAVFPTVTRVNAPSIFTGRHPGGHGLLGNSVYLPAADPGRVLSAARAEDLRAIASASGGRLLSAPSLGEILEEQERVLFAASSGSEGSAMLMNPTGAGGGMVHHSLTLPDSLGRVVASVLGPVPAVPDGAPELPYVARAVDAVLRIGVDRADADLLAAWLTEPDGTAHAHGVGAPETLAVLREVDTEIGRLLDGLAERGVLVRTNVLVTSDHGFSQRVGTQSLEELLVAAGLKESEGSLDVVVAGDAIHVREGGEEKVRTIVRLLQATGWIGPVFTAAREPGSDFGRIPGTLSYSAVGWDHWRSADILTGGDWTGERSPWGYPGVVRGPGVAGHGTSSPWDLRAALVAAGPAIKRGVVSRVPTGNVDLAPTALHLLRLPAAVDFDGRVLTEILREGPAPSSVVVESDPVSTETAVPGGGTYRLTAERLRVGGTRYLEGTRVERAPPADRAGTVRARDLDRSRVPLRYRSRIHEPESFSWYAALGQRLTTPDERELVRPESDALPREPHGRRLGPPTPSGKRYVEVRRFRAPEARQGVTVDADHFYAIDNHRIAKYSRATGEKVGEWRGTPDGPLVHLNSCVVLDGRLVCSHSNYPGIPMLSSVEIFDAGTMEHIDSHSFGRHEGSLTWTLARGGEWWAAFAHYGNYGGIPGRGPEWTSLIRFDDEWNRREAFAFPASLIDRFSPHSTSGGNWGEDGNLYVTGHDAREIYVLRLPDMGSVLVWVDTRPAPMEGQAWGFEPGDPATVWGIVRGSGEVVVGRLEANRPEE